ncbi:iron-sulfur cluster assembly scaffold protein [Chloroflexota bacterium]
MTTSWEKFEEFLKQEMRKVFPETFIDHSMNPRNVGSLENSEGFAEVTGPCGDTMKIWLRVRDVTIAQATLFWGKK